MLKHELCGLETFGEILVGRLLDHARTGKADHALGLGKVDVADGCK